MVEVEERGKSVVVGAAPEGASDQQSAARAVREMFTSIAPRYDLLNHVLSLNIDRHVVAPHGAHFLENLARPDARILDLCCGTGDMTFALRRRLGRASDASARRRFSHAMLQRARAKSRRQEMDYVRKMAQPASPDGSKLTPSIFRFPAEHFGLVTSAFGFRNLADYDAGLREIVRVLAAQWRMRHPRFRRARRSDGTHSTASTSSRCCRVSAP